MYFCFMNLTKDIRKFLYQIFSIEVTSIEILQYLLLCFQNIKIMVRTLAL